MLQVELDVSAPARRYIRGHGARLFVWFKDVGPAFIVQQVSTRAPAAGPEFTEFPDGDITVFLQRDFDPPERLKVRLRRWLPYAPISVTGTVPVVHVDQRHGGGYGRGWPQHQHGHGGGGAGGGGHHGGHHGGGHGGGHGG
jgi:hypothetical protein